MAGRQSDEAVGQLGLAGGWPKLTMGFRVMGRPELTAMGSQVGETTSWAALVVNLGGWMMFTATQNRWLGWKRP